MTNLSTTAPILREAHETKPFIINTHDSSYTLGAVLIQGEGKDEQPISRASNGYSEKFTPRRDDPYIIVEQRGPTSYKLANADDPESVIGTYLME